MQFLTTILAFGLLTLAGPAFAQTVGDVEYGLASYYSDDFQGRQTSYGEQYDKNAMTAAHKRYPYNSRIRVTRMDNNKSVVVRVIDQGPFIRGRVVDLSRRAAETLGLINDNTAEVKVELLELPDRATAATGAPAATARGGSSTASTTTTTRPSSYDNQLPPPEDRLREVQVTTSASDSRAQEPRNETTAPTTSTTSTRPAGSTSTRPTSSSSAQEAQAPLVRKNFNEYGLYKIEIRRPASRGWGVQVASMSDYESAMRQVATLQTKWFDNILMSIEPAAGGKTYKIILDPFDSEASAQRYERDLARRYKISGFTVNLNNISYQR